MAPEIIKSLQYDEKCDLWSLGITLYEILFGYLPYGKVVTLNLIKKSIIYADNFIYGKTNIKEINILFEKLLTINRKNRISYKDYFDYINKKIKVIDVFNSYKNSEETEEDNFSSRACSINFSKIRYSLILMDEIKEEKNIYSSKNNVMSKIINIVEDGNLIDIMNFPNGSIDSKQIKKYNNILYYDENINYINSINNDSNFFEKNTPGAFILYTNLDSLKLIKEEILNKIKKYKRTTFNLITTGSKCEKVMEFINKDKNFEECIKNVCIYCIELGKYQSLKEKYPKIHDDIYNKRTDVINFINKFSSEDIKAFPLTKLITYQEYIDKYKERHIKIAEFYGDFNPQIYQKSMNNMATLIDEESEKNELKKKDKNELLRAFSEFDIIKDNNISESNSNRSSICINQETQLENNNILNKDIEELDKLLIKEYTKNTFYGDLNKWLMNSKINSYESIAYFTARLMYSLNSYAKKNKMFLKLKKFFIGELKYHIAAYYHMKELKER